MATYKVKKDDNLAVIAKSAGVSVKTLTALNPGVPKVSAGQIIKVPGSMGGNYTAPDLGAAGAVGVAGQAPSSFSVQTQGSRYEGVNPVTGQSLRLGPTSTWQSGTPNPEDLFHGSAGAVRGFDPTLAMKVQARPTPIEPGPNLGATGQMGASFNAQLNPTPNSQPLYGTRGVGPGYTPPAYSTQLGTQGLNGNQYSSQNPLAPNQYSSSVPSNPNQGFGSNQYSTPVPPGMKVGGITMGGSAVTKSSPQTDVNTAWVKYWNGEGSRPPEGTQYTGGGQVAGSPYIPTKSDVWNMKAAQRRKRMNSDIQDNPQTYNDTFQVPTVDASGNAINQTYTWRF